MEKRLDVYLVENNYFPTRALAQDAIKEERVKVNDKIITKCAYKTDETCTITVIEKELAFVSRAGLKLYHALQNFQVDVKDKVCLDVGASTGGFTDVCLKNGAEHVYAVDVGKDQLAQSLRKDERVTNIESFNCRNLTKEMFDKEINFACMDVSFISIQLILPALFTCMSENFEMIVLVKPQFEAGKSDIGKNGIVKNKKVHERVLKETVDFVESTGYHVLNLDVSSILGRDGNKEFVMHISNKNTNKIFNYKEIVSKTVM